MTIMLRPGSERDKDWVVIFGKNRRDGFVEDGEGQPFTPKKVRKGKIGFVYYTFYYNDELKSDDGRPYDILLGKVEWLLFICMSFAAVTIYTEISTHVCRLFISHKKWPFLNTFCQIAVRMKTMLVCI